MIGVIAKLTVQPGKEDDFEAAAKALVEKVNANEPGCLYYDLYKASEGGVYIFMERYADKDALVAHGKTDYFIAAQAPLGACLAGAPDVQTFSAV